VADHASAVGEGPTADAEPEVLGPAVDRGTGTVLTAHHQGREVLIRRLPAEVDARARARMTLLAERLLGLGGPVLLPVVAVRSRWDVLDIVYDAPRQATSLAALAARRSLSPGEVLFIGRAVADGLATLESAGQTHGRLSAAEVLLTPDGSVLVTGYGIAGVLGSCGSTAGDVRDLQGLLECLDASASLTRYLDGQRLGGRSGVDDRTGPAAAFASALRAVPLPATPPHLSGRPGPPSGLPLARPPARSALRDTWSRVRAPLVPRFGWRALGGVLPAALGVLLLAGWLGASLDPPPPEEPVTAAPSPPATTAGPGERARPVPAQPTAVPKTVMPHTPTPKTPIRLPKAAPTPAPPVPTDWRAVVDDLNTRRSRLLAAPVEDRLGEVDAVGSSAYAADLPIIRSLQARNAGGVDVRTDLISVDVRAAGSDRADLTVVDVLRPYTIRGADGQVLSRRNGRGERTTDVVLVRTDDGWRVAQVSPG
jgi:hypothetical protein